MADSNLQDRANQAQIDLLNKLDRNSDVGVGFYVGFKDTVLSQLRDILKNLNKEATNQLNKGLNEINTSLEKGQKQQEEQNKKLQESLSSKNGKLGKVIDEMTEAAGASQETVLKLQKVARVLSAGSDALLDGFRIAKKATLETAGLATDLKEAGVVLSDGKKSFTETLKDTSLTLGLAREDVVKVLRGSSEQMTKFGVATGKNLNNVMLDAMQHYKNVGDLSSSNAESIMKMHLEAITQSMTQEELSRYNLQQSTAKLTKNIVELSLATGKSVEAITKEQQQRNQNLLVQHAMDKNLVAANRLNAMGLGKDQDALEFILTGRMTEGLTRKFAGNEQYKRLIMSLEQAQRAGRLESATTKEIGEQFNPLLAAANEAAKARVDRLVREGRGNIMYSSPEYQEMLFAGYNLNTQLNIKALDEYNNTLDNGQKGLITQNKLYNVLSNDLETLSNSAKTLSVEGFGALNKALNATVNNLSTVTGWTSNIEKWIHENTGLPAEGTIVPVASAAGGIALEKAGTWGLKKIAGFFKKSPETIANVEKNIPISATPSSIPPKTTKMGKLLKFGKGLGAVGSLATTALVGKDFIEKGIDSTFEEYNKNFNFFDILNPSKLSVVVGGKTGGWFGEKLYDWFGKNTDAKKESFDRVKMIASLANETQLPSDKILDMLDRGISPDKIKEQYSRINTGVEEIKQETPIETKTDIYPRKITSKNQLEELEEQGKEESSVSTISLSKETINAVSSAFAGAIAGNTDILKSISSILDKELKGALQNSRMSDPSLSLGGGINTGQSS